MNTFFEMKTLTQNGLQEVQALNERLPVKQHSRSLALFFMCEAPLYGPKRGVFLMSEVPL